MPGYRKAGAGEQSTHKPYQPLQSAEGVLLRQGQACASSPREVKPWHRGHCSSTAIGGHGLATIRFLGINTFPSTAVSTSLEAPLSLRGFKKKPRSYRHEV